MLKKLVRLFKTTKEPPMERNIRIRYGVDSIQSSTEVQKHAIADLLHKPGISRTKFYQVLGMLTVDKKMVILMVTNE